MKLENNAFFEWYFAHYIQIYGDILSNSIRLDYLVNPIKNWYTYETNNFTQYRTIDREKISVFGLSILEYVKACINAEQYVEIWLNEGFMDRINGKPGDVHIHQNLIYGYDDDMGVLNVLRPGGTFYIFPKALEEDANAFCLKAREFDLLLVPSDTFGVKGYVRFAYCIDTEKVKRSLPALEKLAAAYKK